MVIELRVTKLSDMQATLKTTREQHADVQATIAWAETIGDTDRLPGLQKMASVQQLYIQSLQEHCDKYEVWIQQDLARLSAVDRERATFGAAGH